MSACSGVVDQFSESCVFSLHYFLFPVFLESFSFITGIHSGTSSHYSANSKNKFLKFALEFEVLFFELTMFLCSFIFL